MGRPHRSSDHFGLRRERFVGFVERAQFTVAADAFLVGNVRRRLAAFRELARFQIFKFERRWTRFLFRRSHSNRVAGAGELVGSQAEMNEP